MAKRGEGALQLGGHGVQQYRDSGLAWMIRGKSAGGRRENEDAKAQEEETARERMVWHRLAAMD